MGLSRRETRWILGMWIALALLIGGAFESLKTPAISNRVCALGLGLAGKALGVTPSWGRCTIDPLHASVVVTDLVLSSKEKASDRISLKSLAFSLRPLQALAGGLRVEQVTLRGLAVHWSLPATSKPPATSSSRCWTQDLKLVHVERIEIPEGSVVIDLPTGSLQLEIKQLISHLQRRTYQVSLQADGALQREGKPTIAGKVASAFDLSPSDDLASFHPLTVQVGDNHLEVEGKIDHLCDPRLDLQYSFAAPMTALWTLLGRDTKEVKGTVALSGRVAGSAKNPEASSVLKFSGIEVQGYKAGSLVASLNVNKRRVHFSDLTIDLDPGTAQLQGDLEFTQALAFDVKLNVKGEDFARVMDRLQVPHSLVDFSYQGETHLAGHIRPRLAISGDSTGDVTKLTVDDRGWDRTTPRKRILTGPERLRTKFHLEVDPNGLHFQRAEFRGGGTEILADAQVNFESKRGTSITVDMPKLDLTQLHDIAGVPWAGQGSLKATVSGPYSDIAIEGEIDLDNFQFFRIELGHLSGGLRFRPNRLIFPILTGQKGRTGYTTGGSIDFDRDLFTEINLDVGNGHLEDLTAAIAPLDLAGLRGTMSGVFSGHAQMRGPIERPDASGKIELEAFSIEKRAFSDGIVAAHLVGGKIVGIDQATVRPVAGGHIELAGTLRTDGALALSGTVAKVPLEALLDPGTTDPKGQGPVDLKLELGGTFADPHPSGHATIHGFRVFGVPLGTAELEIQNDHRGGRISGRAGDEATLDGTLGLYGKGPYRATVHAATDNLARYLEGAGFHNPFDGALVGTADLKGDALDPGASTGTFRLSRVELAKAALRIHSEGEVRIDLASGGLTLHPSTWIGTRTRLELSGSKGGDGALDGRAAGQFDARLLDGLIPHVEHLGGLVDIQSEFQGNWGAPSFIGTATVSDGRFSWIGLPLAVRGAAAQVAFSHRRLILNHASAELNGGTAELGGEVHLDGMQIGACDLEATLKDVSLRIPESIPSVVGGHVQLTGDANAGLLLSGTLHIQRARYSRGFEIDQLVSTWQTPGLSGGGDKGGTPLRLDLKLIGDGDLRVENDQAQISLKGELELTGTSNQPGLVGTVSAQAGRVDFRGLTYHLQSAVFAFSDRDQIAPSFDVLADTDARQYRVFVHAFGTPDNYQLVLRSQPNLSKEDIIKLLAFGVTSQDTSTNSAQANYLGDVLWNLSGLQTTVKKAIPHNPVIRDFSFNIGSAYLESTGQVEPVADIESRVLSDDLKFRAQLPLTQANGKRFDAEYRLGEHLSVLGDWTNDFSGYSNYVDIGLDLRMRWEFGD